METAARDFSIEIEIQAPLGLVWAIMRNVERWRELPPTVKSVRLLGSGPPGQESRSDPTAKAAAGDVAGDGSERIRSLSAVVSSRAAPGDVPARP